MPAVLSPAQLARDLAVRDLTDPGAGPHAVQLVVDRAVDALATRWHTTVRREPGERIVTIADNYDNLGYSPTDVTRDARYTRYVDDRRMLRSHSTAMIPAALRNHGGADDVLLVCAGVVYRRDSIDRLHSGTPHQLDLWRVTKRPMRRADLEEMVATLLHALLPGREWRWEPRRHPYTVDGAQVDVRTADGWVEVAECGLAHPDVLAWAGCPGSGLALGLGLDRMLMLIKGIPDIRLLRSPVPAVATQLTDLRPYRPVSPLPPVRRDLSIAVDAGDLAEDLGDRVREALGDDADCVESVAILSETACADLPPRALVRLGARPDQKNLLVRVVLRPYGATLSDAEANVLRDRIHAALHQGGTPQWTAP